MKQSQKTGKEIYEEIRAARKEFDELHEARDVIAEEVGQGTTAFRVMSDCLAEAEQKVRDLERTVYTTSFPGKFQPVRADELTRSLTNEPPSLEF